MASRWPGVWGMGIVLAIAIVLNSGSPARRDRRRRPPRTASPPALPAPALILKPRRSNRTPLSRTKRLVAKAPTRTAATAHVWKKVPASSARSLPHPGPLAKTQLPTLIRSRSAAGARLRATAPHRPRHRPARACPPVQIAFRRLRPLRRPTSSGSHSGSTGYLFVAAGLVERRSVACPTY